MRPFFTLLLPLLFFGCGRQEASRYDKIAHAYCECAGKLVEMNQKAESLANTPDSTGAFQENLRLIQDEYEKTKTCTATIIARFGKLKSAELDSVKLSLDIEKCQALSKQGDLLQEMLGE